MKARDLAPPALLIAPVVLAVLYFVLRGSEPTVPEPPPRPQMTSAPEVSAAPAAPTPAPAAPAASSEKPEGEEAQGLAEIESLLSSNPDLALSKVREQNEKYPGSALADERDYAGVRAWVNLGKIAKARDTATEFYLAHPDSPLVPQVHALTGMHLPPHLNPATKPQ